MNSFVVETYVPAGSRERFAVDVDGLRRAAASEASGGRVRYLRSYLVPADEMGFHLLEAGSASEAEALANRAGIDAERVVAAVRIEPADDEGRPQARVRS